MLPWATRRVFLNVEALTPPALRVPIALLRDDKRIYSTRSEDSRLEDNDFAKARQWYKDFDAIQTLRDVGEVTYSRSSGPGGQNVNKYTLCDGHLSVELTKHQSQF